jgi:hypothetical protein
MADAEEDEIRTGFIGVPSSGTIVATRVSPIDMMHGRLFV